MKIRHENDFYETPTLLTKELLARIDISGIILEPCAGDSAITKALKAYSPRTTGVATRIVIESDLTWGDKRSQRTTREGSPASSPADATTEEFWEYWRSHFYTNYPDCGISWVVTNPPFNKAHQILPLAFEYCSIGVAFLLRSTYSEPCKNRADWLVEHADRLRYRIDISPRPRFRKEGGTDTATVTWFVWQKSWSWEEKGIDSPFAYITDWR